MKRQTIVFLILEKKKRNLLLIIELSDDKGKEFNSNSNKQNKKIQVVRILLDIRREKKTNDGK